MKERPAKTLSPADKWNPNIPFHVTQEELWEHIHEIEHELYPHVVQLLADGRVQVRDDLTVAIHA